MRDRMLIEPNFNPRMPHPRSCGGYATTRITSTAASIFPVNQLFVLTGIKHRAQVYRWIHYGVRIDQAEDICDWMGIRADHVWGQAYTDLILMEDDDEAVTDRAA